MGAVESILHADVDSFFASVEQRLDPALRNRAVVVGVGVVMAASYEAKAFGVKGGMSGTVARRLCPEAIAVEPHFDEYTKASRELFELFRRTAPVVEGLSLEEAFLDVTGLERISGSPTEVATALRRDVRDELGLPISVGIARGKTLAKMASRAAKPDGMLLCLPRASATSSTRSWSSRSGASATRRRGESTDSASPRSATSLRFPRRR